MKYNSQSKMAAVALTLALVVIHVAFPEVAAATDRSSSLLDKEHITNGPIAEYLADTAVSIAWSTRGSAQMAVRYGTDPARLEQMIEAAGKARGHCHHARIEGLKPNTKYFFQVVGEDHEAVDEVGTFQTLAPGANPVTRKVIVP
jgi:phosphodiesterase/alkaline phosphatase D-like protein